MHEEMLDRVSVGLTPFFHSFGYMQLIMGLFGGAKVIVFKKFNAKLFLEAIVKYEVPI